MITLKEKLSARCGAPAISSYSAASSSCKWRGCKNLGSKCCLMLMRRKNGKGKRMPAIGIQVTPKTTSKYTNWNIVKIAMHLNGTDSAKDAWTPSRTLQSWSFWLVEQVTCLRILIWDQICKSWWLYCVKIWHLAEFNPSVISLHGIKARFIPVWAPSPRSNWDWAWKGVTGWVRVPYVNASQKEQGLMIY